MIGALGYSGFSFAILSRDSETCGRDPRAIVRVKPVVAKELLRCAVAFICAMSEAAASDRHRFAFPDQRAGKRTDQRTPCDCS